MILMWIFWILLLVFLSVFSIVSGTMFSLVLLITALILSIVFILLNRIEPKVVFEIRVPERCEKCCQLKGRAVLKNEGLLCYRLINFKLKFKNLLTGEESIQNIKTSLFSKNKCEFDFDLESKLCGTINISCESLKLYDFFGLTYKTLTLEKSFKTTVLPVIFPVKINIKAIGDSISENFSYSEKVGQDLSEVYNFREYVNGDSLRQIQWKLSQKHRNLIVKEGSQPTSQSVALIMLNGESVNAENSSAMAEAFVSISQSLCENGVYHKILLNDDIGIKFNQYDILCEEDIASVIPKILETGNVTDVKGFFENTENLEFEHIVCVTSDSSIADEVLEYCFSVLLAGESQNNKIKCFSPEFMEHELLEIDI